MSPELQERRMELKRLPIKKDTAVAAAKANMKGSKTPSAPSWCYAWCRSVLWIAGCPHAMVPVISSARKAFDYYRGQGWEWTDYGQPNLGDLLFKVGSGAGKSGHVGMYIGNNEVAENSSVHINFEGDTEARGIRNLDAFGPYRIIRPPYLESV